MDINKVWADLQELPQLILRINKRETDAVIKLDSLSKLLFGEAVVANCSNCHIKAFHKLTNITYQNLITMSQKTFKLKKGALIEFPTRSGRRYNDATLTDDIARQILINIPQAIEQFEDYPKDHLGKLVLFPTEIIAAPLSPVDEGEDQSGENEDLTGQENASNENSQNEGNYQTPIIPLDPAIEGQTQDEGSIVNDEDDEAPFTPAIVPVDEGEDQKFLAVNDEMTRPELVAEYIKRFNEPAKSKATKAELIKALNDNIKIS